ncbi:MAG TPA: YidB family protein [Pyrinomonadaceae bacterium]|jgi:uncharacterized protein YidB (DUF937 family)
MALFDSIISETGERFDLTTDQARALLSALLGLISDSTNGGFSGFTNRFRSANPGDAVSSWTRKGDDSAISKEQIESALGAETIAALADRAGLDYATTVSAMTFLLPQTIERLTANGRIPDEQSLRIAADDLNDDSNDSASDESNATSRVSTGAFDRVGNATEDVAGKEHDMLSENRVNDSAEFADRFSGAPDAVSDRRLAENDDDEFRDDSPLKWLVPLILTGLLIALGFWFCGKSSTSHASISAESDFPKTSTINVESSSEVSRINDL